MPFDTLERALAALIQIFAEGHAPANDNGLHPRCRTEISPRDEWARIMMRGAGYDFGRLAESWSPVDDEKRRLGRQSICFINQEVIAHVADGFAEDPGGE